MKADPEAVRITATHGSGVRNRHSRVPARRISRRSRYPPRPPTPRRAIPPISVELKSMARLHRLTLDPRTTLLDALREHLALTGSRRAAITVSAALARCCWAVVTSTPASRCTMHDGQAITTICPPPRRQTPSTAGSFLSSTTGFNAAITPRGESVPLWGC